MHWNVACLIASAGVYAMMMGSLTDGQITRLNKTERKKVQTGTPRAYLEAAKLNTSDRKLASAAYEQREYTSPGKSVRAENISLHPLRGADIRVSIERALVILPL